MRGTARTGPWSGGCGRCLTVGVLILTLLGVDLAVAPRVEASPQLDAVRLCRETIARAGRTYAKRRRAKLLNCIDRLLRCDLLAEVDNLDPTGCRNYWQKVCERRIGPAVDSGINLAAAAFATRVTEACGALDFTNVIMDTTADAGDATATGGSLWWGLDDECMSSANLIDLITCIADAIDDSVDENVTRLKPRAGVLLDNVGLGDGYSSFWRPPTITEVIAATAAGSGVLVDPGTIDDSGSPIAAGTAVKFTGDGTTLPCGGSSNNGRVTVMIAPASFGGTSCTDPNFLNNVTQEVQIKEPYGASEVAIVGPFTADQNYCIDLKDGSCDDTAFGLIDY